MTRTCCCCIPVLGGATLIGILGVLLSLAYMAPLVAYQADLDADTQWNPIKEHIKHIEWGIERSIEEVNKTVAGPSGVGISKEMIDEVMKTFEDNLPIGLMIDLVFTGVYALLCLLMVIGIHCDMRGLMIPYLMLQMLLIIVSIIALLGITVAFFFYQIIMGIVSAAILLIVSFLLVYYWVSVQQAYVELGNRDYMYSPAPTKPYNGHYPSAPQRFEMQACT